MHYFTGSKAHNIRMRERAIKHGFKLNEYGLFDAQRQMSRGHGQRKRYSRSWACPTFRRSCAKTGERWKRPQQGKLPELIQLQDIQGDLHMHTTWSDGKYSTEEMVEAARKRGL